MKIKIKDFILFYEWRGYTQSQARFLITNFAEKDFKIRNKSEISFFRGITQKMSKTFYSFSLSCMFNINKTASMFTVELRMLTKISYSLFNGLFLADWSQLLCFRNCCWCRQGNINLSFQKRDRTCFWADIISEDWWSNNYPKLSLLPFQ